MVIAVTHARKPAAPLLESGPPRGTALRALHLSPSTYFIFVPYSAHISPMICPYAMRLAVAHGAAFAIGYQGSWVTERKTAHRAF